MVVSRDWQEVGVLECILGGLHIGVDVESEPDRARAKLAKSKIDALIIDCDLQGAAGFLRSLRTLENQKSVPLVIVSGSNRRSHLDAMGAAFVFEKPISVEQAVHTLSAARNMILDERLRYHRHTLDVPVSLTCGTRRHVDAHLTNLSQGGMAIRAQRAIPVSGPIRISFHLPGCKSTVKSVGKVAWVDDRGNAGLRFTQISSRVKRDLQLWLERQYFTN